MYDVSLKGLKFDIQIGHCKDNEQNDKNNESQKKLMEIKQKGDEEKNYIFASLHLMTVMVVGRQHLSNRHSPQNDKTARQFLVEISAGHRIDPMVILLETDLFTTCNGILPNYWLWFSYTMLSKQIKTCITWALKPSATYDLPFWLFLAK